MYSSATTGSAPLFAWPVMVINHRGIKCVGCLSALSQSGMRKVQANASYVRLRAEGVQRGQVSGPDEEGGLPLAADYV